MLNVPRIRKNITNGLVGWWTMDSRHLYNNQIIDKSTSNNTGVMYGNITSGIAGKIRQTLNFDGNNGYIETQTKNGLPTGANPSTITLWEKHPESGWEYTFLVSFGSGDVIRDRFILLHNTGGNYVIQPGFYAEDHLDSESAVSNPNTWNFVAWTYDGNITSKIYLNMISGGTHILAAPADTLINQFNIRIGADNYDPIGGQVFSGYIDDLRIYNRVLSNTEIRDIYNWRG